MVHSSKPRLVNNPRILGKGSGGPNLGATSTPQNQSSRRSPALIHQPVEPGKQRLDFAPAAFDQCVKHSALRHPGPAVDTLGIFVALDHDYPIEEIRERPRGAHSRDTAADNNCAFLDHECLAVAMLA